MLITFVAGLAIGSMMGGGSGDDEATLAEIQPDSVRGADPSAPGAAAEPGEPGATERYRATVPENAPQRGPEDALVTIAMWSDYQCPFCSRVEPTLSRIVNEHRNDVRIVWRDNPLPFHQLAGPAAQAAREVYAQAGNDKFWEFHDLMFENQRALERADLERYATQVGGIDMNRFRQALDNNTHRAAIEADQREAGQLGAQGTPAFFINGIQLMGAQPYEQFNEVITRELANARAMVQRGTPRNQVYASLIRNARTSPAPQPAAPNQPQQPQRQPDPAAIYRVPVGDSPSKGPDNALVTIVEFSEFQCPFCSRVLPTVNQIRERYGNDVRVVFKHNPLPFHPNAMPASEAAMEVQAQLGDEMFFRYHDTLFENQQNLTRENLEQWAQALPGINMARFRAALDNHTHQAAIEADQTLARNLGASGTPSFFINGRNVRGAQPFPAFQAVIDEEMTRARAMVQSGTPRGPRLYDALIANGATEPQFIAAPGGGAAAPAAPAEPPPDQVYEIPVPRNAPSMGPANAPVTIQLFSDFQCPFCSRVNPTLEQVREQFGNRVRIVWRNYPLPFHQNAMPAAQAAMEVFAQGGNDKFWQYHRILFENQQALSREDLERYAQQVGGIDMNRFRQALDNNTHQAAVQADMDAVSAAGARIGTPSSFINGRLLQGAQPFPAFEAAINRAIEEH
ncbi:MAG: DsbA family protein [Sandaracinaceae bacterium]